MEWESFSCMFMNHFITIDELFSILQLVDCFKKHFDFPIPELKGLLVKRWILVGI